MSGAVLARIGRRLRIRSPRAHRVAKRSAAEHGAVASRAPVHAGRVAPPAVRAAVSVTGSLLLASALAACASPQSTLAPAGVEAERVARLFWAMLAGASVVWIAVLGFALYVTRADAERHGPRATRWLIIGGGVVFPTVVLGGLLAYGLALMPPLRADASPGAVRVHVSGEQWWWRVRYRAADGEWIELANEVRLPVGERTELELVSPDVIHSFWIPPLGGKMDMIPGRVNRLVLEPTRAGVFRGVCAEYCGASHAHMEFVAVVMQRDAFARWLHHQAAPAKPPGTPLAQRGARTFLRQGCGGCRRG